MHREPARAGSRRPLGPPAPALPGFEHINRHWDPTRGNWAARILPGEYYVTRSKELVVTTLGSCVSACVRDVRSGLGGMNHFMLPVRQRVGTWEATCANAATRYGQFAMEMLINTILANGGSRMALEVKIFGGGRILRAMTDIGASNVRFVHEYLEAESLAIAAEDCGGIYPRNVVYYPWSGRVRVLRLRSLRDDTIVRRERTYMDSLDDKPIVGDIELF